MVSKLAKALGLRQRSGAAAEQVLPTLILKCKCAGDTYYHDMDQSIFDNAMKGEEGEAFYRFYVRQRKIGIQAFKSEVVEDLAKLSGAALYAIIEQHNYDSGTWFLTQIVAHPQCEFATALVIYWANQPAYVYERYGTIDLACQDTDSFLHARAELLDQIERKTKQDAFAHNLPIPHVGCFLDGQPDYSTKPFANMPSKLRVDLRGLVVIE
ncbi:MULTISPECIES: DUF4274 domain-containing protein [unclassified Rhizobium]|uniref:DUF4274 domain-containing protein n=1 Tax=unclassified Rhizobium TaxID=2613769 RepID=UPI00381CFE32